MNIVSVPSLKSELLACTSLTPTQHKGGGGMKSIVGLVASVAIPFAAPFVASSLMASFSVANAAQSMWNVASSALVGGLMGAGVSKVMGGDVATGALGGAFGGAIGGYNAGGLGKGSGIGFGSNVAPPMTAGLGTSPTGAATATISNLGPESAVASQVDTTGASSLADQFTSGDPSYKLMRTDMGRGGLGSTSAVTAVPTSGLNTGVEQFDYTMGSTAGAPTFTDKAMSFAKGLPDKILSSEGAQAAASKLLTNAVSSRAVGDTPDMSSFEKARMADLQRARNFQEQQQNEKKAISDSYTQMASNINPEYYGQQALTQEQNRLLRAQQAGLRGVSAGRAATQSRQNALDKSRLSGYDRGRQEAESKRLQYMRAAQSSAPAGSGYASDIASDLAAEDKRYERLKAAGQESSDVVQPIFDGIFGVKSKKERDEDALKKGG